MKLLKSAVIRAVEVTNACGEGREQLMGHGGHLVDDAVEVALADDEQRAVGLRTDRRGAWAVVEQRQLSDDRTLTERRHLFAIATHDRHAFQQDVCLTAGLSLIDDQCAGLYVDLIGGFCDALEFLVGAREEQWNVTKMLERRFETGHIGDYTPISQVVG